MSALGGATHIKSIAPADHGHSRSLCSIMLKEVELIILNWTKSIESKVDTAIIFFRKMRGIYVHAAFAPTTGTAKRWGGGIEKNEKKKKITFGPRSQSTVTLAIWKFILRCIHHGH